MKIGAKIGGIGPLKKILKIFKKSLPRPWPMI
jgi:hypothetical protein